MAIICPKCKHQYDATLFEFGNVVECDCGARIRLDLKKGLITDGRETKRRAIAKSSQG